MSETFTLYARLKSRSWRMDEHDIHLEPRRLLGETPVRFYWLLAHPASAYYFDGKGAWSQ